jgi:hypothetical protein
MKLKGILATGLLAALTLTGAAASAQFERGQHGSNDNMWDVRQRVEGMIDQLQHDDHDYGGHRIAAINDLQAARNQIVAAEQFARQHGY